jgi:hypothetical protein
MALLGNAFPTANHTVALESRSFQGSINWFTRYDCQNPCVEIGYCLSGQTSEGMSGSSDPWIGWDSGCWDRPDGAHSVALSVSNGHKFKAISKSCEEWKKDNFNAQSWDLAREDSYSDGKCNVLSGEGAKAVYYVW